MTIHHRLPKVGPSNSSAVGIDAAARQVLTHRTASLLCIGILVVIGIVFHGQEPLRSWPMLQSEVEPAVANVTNPAIANPAKDIDSPSIPSVFKIGPLKAHQAAALNWDMLVTSSSNNDMFLPASQTGEKVEFGFNLVRIRKVPRKSRPTPEYLKMTYQNKRVTLPNIHDIYCNCNRHAFHKHATVNFRHSSKSYSEMRPAGVSGFLPRQLKLLVGQSDLLTPYLKLSLHQVSLPIINISLPMHNADLPSEDATLNEQHHQRRYTDDLGNVIILVVGTAGFYFGLFELLTWLNYRSMTKGRLVVSSTLNHAKPDQRNQSKND